MNEPSDGAGPRDVVPPSQVRLREEEAALIAKAMPGLPRATAIRTLAVEGAKAKLDFGAGRLMMHFPDDTVEALRGLLVGYRHPEGSRPNHHNFADMVMRAGIAALSKGQEVL